MSNSFHHHLKVDFSSQTVSRPQQKNSSNYNQHQFTFGSNNKNNYCVVMKKQQSWIQVYHVTLLTSCKLTSINSEILTATVKLPYYLGTIWNLH